MEKQRRLYYHDGLSRVVQRQVVSVQLRQYSTCIQMRVGLSSSLLRFWLNLQRLLQIDQRGPKVTLLSVIAGKVIVRNR